MADIFHSCRRIQEDMWKHKFLQDWQTLMNCMKDSWLMYRFGSKLYYLWDQSLDHSNSCCWDIYHKCLQIHLYHSYHKFHLGIEQYQHKCYQVDLDKVLISNSYILLPNQYIMCSLMSSFEDLDHLWMFHWESSFRCF